MQSFKFLSIAFALTRVLAQECSTVTELIVQPTTTATYLSTQIVTLHPTTARDLGTFTLWDTISSTKTLMTLTSLASICASSADQTGTIPVRTYSGSSVVTVYTSATLSETTPYSSDPDLTAAAYKKRGPELRPRDGLNCTVTVTSTTTYGLTYRWIPADATSTFLDYTAFTQATVTSTTHKGTTYAIATAAATISSACNVVSGDSPLPTSKVTVTQDVRCAPTALISAWQGFGLEWQDDTPLSGAHWTTTTDDPSQCCQVCAEHDGCAASSWDIRTQQCIIEFPVDFETGNLNCGEGLLAFYDAGPLHPMAPGTGLFLAELCGSAVFANAKPDDGT